MIRYIILYYIILYYIILYCYIMLCYYIILYYIILYYIFNCNLVVTRWQYTFTHKQYKEQYSSQIWKSAGRAPSMRGIPRHLPYN